MSVRPLLLLRPLVLLLLLLLLILPTYLLILPTYLLLLLRPLVLLLLQIQGLMSGRVVCQIDRTLLATPKAVLRRSAHSVCAPCINHAVIQTRTDWKIGTHDVSNFNQLSMGPSFHVKLTTELLRIFNEPLPVFARVMSRMTQSSIRCGIAANG